MLLAQPAGRLRRLEPPSADHWLGTTAFGNDVLSQLLFNFRVAFLVGVVAGLAVRFISTFFGIISGYFGGVLDDVLMRITDVALSIPTLLFAIVAVGLLKPSIQGRIINMASQVGRRGEPLVTIYCASKAAVISLTQSAGLNHLAHGINVFAKYEGRAPSQKKKEVAAAVPFGRMGTAHDLTGMAALRLLRHARYAEEHASFCGISTV